MERVLQHEAAINYDSREQGSAEKSSETSPRKSYSGSPEMRYGLSLMGNVSAGGASETNPIFDHDKLETSSESSPKKNCQISPAKFTQVSHEKSSMEDTGDTLILPDEGSTESSKTSPRKGYQGFPAMRYRAWNEKSSSTADGKERSLETQPEKSPPAFFKPGKCPHPYFDFPKQHVERLLEEPVEEKQEPLQNTPSRWQDSEAEFRSGGEADNRAYLSQRSLASFQSSTLEAAQQQAMLEEEFRNACTRGQFAAIANGFTRMQKLETESQAKIIRKITENVQYTAVMALLRGLVDEYSEQSFQLELQKLFIDARKLQKHNNGNGKIIPGRCELCRSVQEKVLASIDIPKAATVSVWKMVGAFAHKRDVVWQLSVLDELLALPPNSNLKAAVDCRVENHSVSSPAQVFQPLRTLRSVVAY